MPNLIKKSWTVSNNYVDNFTKFLIFHNIPGQKIREMVKIDFLAWNVMKYQKFVLIETILIEESL